MVREDIPGAKRPSYSIVNIDDDLTQLFSDVRVVDDNGRAYLHATYKGNKEVRERLLPLDADRYRRGDMPLQHLL